MPEHSLATVLLIEDEPSDAALVRRGFEKAKVLNPVVHLKSGDEALAYLAGQGKYGDRIAHPMPALILLDLKLPGLTGFQLLGWMRASELRRIPVIVLTGDNDPGTINAAYDLGANSYLVKPGDPKDIARLVESIQRYWLELNEPPQLVMKAQEPGR